MKKINPIALKDAKILGTEEMKHLFGGSAAKEDSGGMTSCTTDCGTQPSRSITNCKGTCTAHQGSSVVCTGSTKILTKYCDGTSSISYRG